MRWKAFGFLITVTFAITLATLAIVPLLAHAAHVSLSPDALSVGLGNLHWDMSPAQAQREYPALKAKTAVPGTFPLTNLESLFLDNYQYAGCTFFGVLRFDADMLKSVELTEIAPRGVNPPCKSRIEAEFSKQYGVPIARHERSMQPWNPFAGLYGRYRGKITWASYESTPNIEISFSDKMRPPKTIVVYDGQPAPTNSGFIGLWRNSQNDGRCKYFPSAVRISMVNESHAQITFPGSTGYDEVARPTADAAMLNAPAKGDFLDFGHDKFHLVADNTMIFTQIGPDGLDNCNFLKEAGPH